MTDKNTELEQEQALDPLDMNNYKVEKLPKMDNPVVPIDSVDGDGRITTVEVEKIYYVNIVFQLQHDGKAEYHHFRISMTRDGVLDIMKID